jgi:hypothetical protein
MNELADVQAASTRLPLPLDLRESPALARELPGLATAFDPQQMLPRLQDALFGGRGRYRIEACRQCQATCLPGASCLLRYELEVTDESSDRTLKPLVAARVFRRPLGWRRYVRARLAPLAERAHGRDELEPFARPVAVLTGLNAALAVYPIDGELPTLLDATDPARIADVLRRALPEAAAGRFDVKGCRVERGHYGRQHRCVLRYEVEGVVASSGAEERRVVYGKVTAARRGALAGAALTALRESEQLKTHVRVPGLLGFDPKLQLLLVEALAGAPKVSQLVAAGLAGQTQAEPSQTGSDVTLEAAIEKSSRAAAALHASGIRLGRRRGVAEELAGLTVELRDLRRLSPDLVELLSGWLRRAEVCLKGTDPLPPAFSHGDFSHTQVLFEGARCGLVDFDTVCQAEPALDLGHFLAYLRLSIAKARGSASSLHDDLADQLSARFLDAYVAAASDGLRDEARLRARVPAYEVISLVRLALHSWRKFKPSRLAYVLTLLEERASCLLQSTR